MKNIYTGFICLIILLICGCQKGPYPYISLQEAKKIDSTNHPAIKNVAFIYKGNIYYVADFTKPAVQITNDGSSSKLVRMSHDHTKYAYLNALKQVVVVDNTGKQIAVLTQYSQVKCFDWSADDKTLYILNGNAMVYYGAAMNLPAFSIPSGSEQSLVWVSVSMQGDLAYVAHWFDFFNGDQYELVVQPAGNGKKFVYTNPDEAAYEMDYVNFSANKQDMVLGYRDPNNSNSDVQESMEIFTELKTYPDFTYGGGCTPLYNSTVNYIVMGYTGSNPTAAPAALYVGPTSDMTYTNESAPQNIFLTNYSSSNSNFYTDWK
jgi:hypothetical protein